MERPDKEQLLDLLLMHSPCGVLVLDGAELTIREANPAFCAMAQLETPPLGRRLADVFPLFDADLCSRLRDTLANGSPVLNETLESRAVTTAAGEPTHWRLSVHPLAGEPERLALLLEARTEQVTLQQQAEHRAQQLEAAYHALAEDETMLGSALKSARVTLINRDKDLRATFLYNIRWDQAPYGLLGTVPEEVYCAEDAQALREFYHPVLERGENAQSLVRLRYRSGRENWIELFATPLRDEQGNITGTRAVNYDVTSHVETRYALAKREAVLELALDVSDMAQWEYDRQTCLVQHSASLPRILGLPDQDRPAPLHELLQLVHPDDLTRLQDEIQHIRDTGTVNSRISSDFRIVRPDGKTRWLGLRGQIIGSTSGRAERLVGIIVDSTEENQLRQRLEQSNRELERFAYMVAHDIKSPLNSIQGFGSLLLRSAQERLHEAERDHLGYVLEAAEQMRELIDGVLEHARATQTEVQEEVDLEDALERCLLRLHNEIDHAGAVITHEPLPRVMGHRILLTQALQNLLSNAIKFRSPEPLYVHISARPADAEWVVSVRDNGIGIPEEHQAELFNAFSRAHADRGYSGLGLGLNLVRDAVQHHGGRVWLRSAPGEGSTFFFSLPQ